MPVSADAVMPRNRPVTHLPQDGPTRI